MAHEVYEIAGGHSIAFAEGVTPWHGLGQAIDPDASLEVWASTAHLDWAVLEAPVSYVTQHAGLQSYNGKKVLYRSDNGLPLSVVSDDYKVVQPIACLEFFRNLVEQKGMKIHTAGSLRHGKRVWALASLPKGVKIGSEDQLYPFLLLATSYDKSLATTAKFTFVQVVCSNTIELAYADHATSVKVPHSTTFDPTQVQLDLGLVDEAIARFAEDVDRLSNRPVTREQAVDFFVEVLHDDGRGEDYGDVPLGLARGLWRTFTGGVGQDKVETKETAWGLVSATTRFLDHERRARSQDSRLESAWFGTGNKLKQRAFDKALQLV